MDRAGFTTPLTIQLGGTCATPSTCQTRRPRVSKFPAPNRALCTCVTKTPVATAPVPVWQNRLKPGAVVEYFTNGILNLGLVVSNNEKTTELNNPEDSTTIKIAHGEIISVWSKQMSDEELLQAKREAEEMLSANTVDISALYNERARGKRSIFNSNAAGRSLFPDAPSTDVATIAAGRVISAHKSRFRRAEAGQGWRANPPAVAATREAEAFVKAVKLRLDGTTIDEAGLCSTESRAFLNALEVCAASGTKPNKTLGRIMKELDYEDTSAEAGKLLRDIGVWQEADKEAPQWTFSAEALEAARNIRRASKEKRLMWHRGSIQSEPKRRNLLDMAASVYCIDNRSTNFFDDALSIEILEDQKTVRVSVHIADVAGMIEQDSLLDKVARDRAQSMYLPLRPLHMIPPPAMESASFSEDLPTECITVEIDYHLYQNRVLRFDVFPSVVPPVLRVSFDQLDRILASNRKSLPYELSEERCRDLRTLANFTAALVKIMKRPVHAPRDESEISDVRLVTRMGRDGRTYREARVSRYRNNGAHTVLGDLLGVAGAILRQQARSAGVALPEEPGAANYARRCGTAPLRRYVDLATQRQIRNWLMGLPCSGSEEMEALRKWLTKRLNETQKTVNRKRGAALFENFAEIVASQKSITGREFALMKGMVINRSVSKKGVCRVRVRVEGVGVDVMVKMDKKFEEIISKRVEEVGVVNAKDAQPMTKVALMGTVLDKLFPNGSLVRMRVDRVDSLARDVDATVVDKISNEKVCT